MLRISPEQEQVVPFRASERSKHYVEYQRATKSAQKEQSQTPSSSLRQMSLNHVAVHPLLELQRTIGNQAVLNLLRSQNAHIDASTQVFREPRFGHDFSRIPIHPSQTVAPQTKLKVNQPGDMYEQEADQVAEQVMRRTDVESPVSDNEDETKKSLMRKQSTEPQADASTDSSNVSPVVHTVLNSGGGQPLDTTTRAFMEPRFGHDFSQVRVHTGARAAESAQAVNALAYTAGRNVVFGMGQYQPKTGEGKKLLAHELAHVVQQSKLPSEGIIRRTVVPTPPTQRVVSHTQSVKWDLALPRDMIESGLPYTPGTKSAFNGLKDDMIGSTSFMEQTLHEEAAQDRVQRITDFYIEALTKEVARSPKDDPNQEGNILGIWRLWHNKFYDALALEELKQDSTSGETEEPGDYPRPNSPFDLPENQDEDSSQQNA